MADKEGLGWLEGASAQRASVVMGAGGPAAPEIDYSKKRFLVIDSLQEMRSAMNMTLTTFGVTKIEYALRATEAIGMLKRSEYDVVLCEYDLGHGYDGLHLLEEVKLRNIIKPSSIFMVVTGERRAKLVISAVELAPDDYLLKPFTGEQLKQRLDRVYRKKLELQCVDDAMVNQDYLKALAECNKRIAERGPFVLDFLKLKGRLSLMIGDHSGAKATYESVLRVRPIPWAKMGLAKALFHLKDYDASRSIFENVLAENDRVMEAYDWLSRIHQAEHAYPEAQSVLLQAVEISPAIVHRQKKLGEVAMRNGDFEVAEAAYQQTISLAKYSFWRDAGDYASLNRVQLAKGDVMAAAKTAAEVRKEFRYDQQAEVLATVMECQVSKVQGNDDRANTLLDKARTQLNALGGRVPDNYVLEIADACYRLGREEDAGSLVQQVLKNHHENTEMLERVSLMYDVLGRAELGQQLIEENAQNIVEINNRAVRAAQAGDLDGAVELFMQAVEEMPANVQVALNAVNALLAYVARRGWHDHYMEIARQYLERIRVIDPANGKYLKLFEAYKATRRQFKVA
ncbi:tetratricopeptide repeat-containing response regulator [Parachitinimonas caeni]|uniref:Response regulator n=1 Tax=Parachitinimonas caeni TaxID=3031301 RepID=A0ABT7DR59_9NEIS|nr:tetratricopeptide repeat-containing response regulator [Parachitinimonas caeni]MDK2122546.1 response regulator [Parachitinimonas caeni]